MKWEEGRQGTGYKKHKFFQISFGRFGGMDLYLLKYSVGDSIPQHTDHVIGYRHFRINLELTKAKDGGNLYVENPIIRFGRLTIFRSDLSKHSVSLVRAGRRYVLSLGVAV